MTNSSDDTVRRYSDLLTTGYIKTGTDGRKIFYPWGVFGKGYAFPSNAAYERLNDLLKIFTVVALAIILPVAVPGHYVAAVILVALSWIYYAVWTSFEVRKLQRTDEKLTYGEGMTNMAVLMPGWLLWPCAILSLLFVVAGIVMLITEPSRWMVALGTIVFFGLCTVVDAVMLVRRRRILNAQS
jgi:hypothetical protein